MPSPAAAEAIRLYRTEGLERATRYLEQVQQDLDNSYLRGSRWEQEVFEVPGTTPVPVDITTNDIKQGWELVDGRLIKTDASERSIEL